MSIYRVNFEPNETNGYFEVFNTARHIQHLKSIAYRNLVKNVNAAIGTSSFKINDQIVSMPEGYYTYNELCVALQEAFISSSVKIEVNSKGNNIYSLINAGSDSVKIEVSESLRVLLGFDNLSYELSPGGFIGYFNTDINLGATHITLGISGLSKSFILPIIGYYAEPLLYYSTQSEEFSRVGDSFKICTLQVHYVSIGQIENLKYKNKHQIVFCVN